MRPGLPARLWNELVDRLRRLRPQAGAGCRLRALSSGYSISSLPLDSALKHPWYTTASYDLETQKWVARVQPGFVNGIDPTISVYDPETKKSSPKGLLSVPEFPLAYAVSRTAGDATLPIPPFFKEMGAATDESLSVNKQTGQVIFKDNPPGRRDLYSVDIYLDVARVSVNGSVQITDATGISGSVASYIPVFDNSAVKRYGLRPRLMSAGNLRQQQELTERQRIISSLTGEAATDYPADQLLVSTVYFLTPPESSDAMGVETWAPFVQHHLFYNVNYASKNLLNVKVPPKPITIFTGLAGGLGDIIANQMLAPLNDAAAALSVGLTNITQNGRFWTI